MTFWSFHGPGWLLLGGTRFGEKSQLAATLSAQSARHGAWPGPNLVPSLQEGPLRASQPRMRDKAAAGKEMLPICKKVHFVHICIRADLSVQTTVGCEEHTLSKYLVYEYSTRQGLHVFFQG